MLDRRLPVALTLLFVFCVPASAQVPWPERGSNLQVLPPDTSTEQLRRTMFGFSNALGVNCIYCHWTEDRNDWSKYDFASDAKATKRTARTMMRMVRSINASHLAEIPDRGADALQVRCATCHRGTSIPEPIERRIARTLREEGLERAIDEYRKLAERHAGGMAFDLGPGPLNALGYTLLEDGEFDAAVAVFRLNAENHPEDANLQDSLAEGYMKAGKTIRAIAHYTRALQMDPDNENAVRMLEALHAELAATGR